MNDKDQAQRNVNTPPAGAHQEVKALESGGKAAAKEIGGTKGLEPTRYGDWSHKGIVSDF